VYALPVAVTDRFLKYPTRPASETQGPTGTGFMPEIQGLRAIAVGLVLLYHVSDARLPRGGFTGVDVFFVISGFLITGHLTREARRDGTIRLRRFYERRARRLLPAAFVVLVATAAVTYLWVPQTLWAENGRQIIASALYVENWALASNAIDYAAPAADTSPVQHFWSLGVEEQFYLAWPLLLIAAARLRPGNERVGLLAISVVLIVSFALSVVQTADDAGLAYFVSHTRVWELAAGGLLSYAAVRLWAQPNRLRVLLAWAGLALIAASAFGINGTGSFPGVLALGPVLGAALVIAAGYTRGPVAPSRLLRLRPVQWLGDISYSLYLWHWPLLILLPFILDKPLGGAEKALVVLPASLALAALSKRVVEDRFRADRPKPLLRTGRAVIAAGSIASVLIVGSAAAMVGTARTNEDRAERTLARVLEAPPRCFGAAAVAPGAGGLCRSAGGGSVVPDPIIAGREPTGLRTAGCLVDGPATAAKPCVYGPSAAREKVALVGDSHAAQWLLPLVAIAERRNWSVTTFLKSGCPMSTAQPVSMDRFGAACTTWNRNVLAKLRSGGFTKVVVSAFSGLEYKPAGGESGTDTAARGMAASWRQVQAAGRTVVAIRDNPLPSAGGVSDTPSCVERNEAPASCATERAASLRPDVQAAAAALVPGAEHIDLTRYFCPDGSTCPAVIGGVLVYESAGHITKTYARTLQATLAAHLDTATR
jgi:peptidoglycan/LPS O-acetylase OafA/YrhL